MKTMSKGLKIDVRRKKILDLLAQNGEVRIADLTALFDTTEVTIRSDLSALENDGYLQRVTGGAVQTVRNFYNLDYIQRGRNNLAFKRAVGQAAADMISDGETLLINSGATTSAVAGALRKKRNLSIVTNSVTVAMELGEAPSFRVILLGGNINVRYAFTYGSDALEELEHYRADHAILSIDGISAEAGLTTYHAEEATIDRAMIRRARSTLVVADYSKIGRESFTSVGALDQRILLITNQCADREQVRAIGGQCGGAYRCDDNGAMIGREEAPGQ